MIFLFLVIHLIFEFVFGFAKKTHIDLETGVNLKKNISVLLKYLIFSLVVLFVAHLADVEYNLTFNIFILSLFEAVFITMSYYYANLITWFVGVKKLKITYADNNAAFVLFDQTIHIVLIALLTFLIKASLFKEFYSYALMTAAVLMLLVFIGDKIVEKVCSKENLIDSSKMNIGSLIGKIERILIFVSLATGFPTGIAIVVAVKSIIRLKDENKIDSNYFILGTLTSLLITVIFYFAWRLLQAFIYGDFNFFDSLVPNLPSIY